MHWLRQLLEHIVKSCFPNLIDLAIERGNAIDDPDVLEGLILALARVEEEAQKILSK